MKLELGKTYLDGAGRTVKIVWHDATDDTFSSKCGIWFALNGHFLGDEEGSPRALVDEVVVAPLGVVVGDVWLTRSGTRIKIIATDIPGDQPIAGYPLNCEFDVEDSRVWTCYQDGCGYLDRDSELDLVSKEPTPVAYVVRDSGGTMSVLCVTREYAEECGEGVAGRTIHPLYERP